MSEKMLNLEALAGGGFAERVNQAVREVMENIADPNTPYKTKRKVTINMTFEAKEDRDITNVDIVTKVTLAPRESVHTTVLIDRDLDGEIMAAEYKKQITGQTAIKVDSETGEVLNPTVEDLKGLQLVK
ncbi:MAG TPA: replication terminator protein [Clostridiaceae bacterium]